MLIPPHWPPILVTAAVGLILLRLILSYKSILFLLTRWWRWLDDKAQVYQYFEIPRYSQTSEEAENPLYRKAVSYVASLPSLEDSDSASLFFSPARKSNDFSLSLQLGPGQTVQDSFQGARLSWSNPGGGGPPKLVLRVRRQDRTRVLRPYLQYVESVSDEAEARRRDLKLFTNSTSGFDRSHVWSSVAFTHPASIDTLAMDPELKNRISNDLESFLKGRNYYHNLGRVWRRSYLLYGAPGTGKSSFAAAMARFLGYDVYDVDLTRVGGSDLQTLLARTTPKSLILIEDLDRHLAEGTVHLSEILNFMDGIFSCCGEERVMVFTMSSDDKEGGIDPAVLRPGRLDVHIHFPMCDFAAFKTLAGSYLGIKDHKLYPQVEEEFQNGAQLSPAEVGEIMITNRGSPNRAIKTVIGALQHTARSGSVTRRGEDNRVGEEAGGLHFGKDSTIKEFKKLYGLIKVKSRREGTLISEGMPTTPGDPYRIAKEG
ncbi:P-loop containing nucleoside triphosphate hydrolases superfamily protein [Carex rostrata]